MGVNVPQLHSTSAAVVLQIKRLAVAIEDTVEEASYS
jgi:hypothetical protein